jgi:hypothetical protein
MLVLGANVVVYFVEVVVVEEQLVYFLFIEKTLCIELFRDAFLLDLDLPLLV